MASNDRPDFKRGVSKKIRSSRSHGAQGAAARDSGPSVSPGQARSRLPEQPKALNGTITRPAPTQNGEWSADDAVLLHFAPPHLETNYYSQYLNGAGVGLPTASNGGMVPTAQNGAHQIHERLNAQYLDIMDADIPHEFTDLLSPFQGSLEPLPIDFGLGDCSGEDLPALQMNAGLNVPFGPESQGTSRGLGSTRQLPVPAPNQARPAPLVQPPPVLGDRKPPSSKTRRREVAEERQPSKAKAFPIRGSPRADRQCSSPSTEGIKASRPTVAPPPPRFSEQPAQLAHLRRITDRREQYDPEITAHLRQDSDLRVKEGLFKARLASLTEAGTRPPQDRLSQQYVRVIEEMNNLIIGRYKTGCRSDGNVEVAKCVEGCLNPEYQKSRLVADLGRLQRHVAANPQDHLWVDDVVRQLEDSIASIDSELLGRLRQRSSDHRAAGHMGAATGAADLNQRTASARPRQAKVDLNDGMRAINIRSGGPAGHVPHETARVRESRLINNATEYLNTNTPTAQGLSGGERRTSRPFWDLQGGINFPSAPYLHTLLSKAMDTGHVPAEAAVAAVRAEPAAYGVAATTHSVTQHFLDRLLEEAEKLYSNEVAALAKAKAAEEKATHLESHTRKLEAELARLNLDSLRQTKLKADQGQHAEATKATIQQMQKQLEKDAVTIIALRAKEIVSDNALKALRQEVAKNETLSCSPSSAVSTANQGARSNDTSTFVLSSSSRFC